MHGRDDKYKQYFIRKTWKEEIICEPKVSTRDDIKLYLKRNKCGLNSMSYCKDWRSFLVNTAMKLLVS